MLEPTLRAVMAALLTLASGLPAAAQDRPRLAITGGQVHTIDGPVIADGVVLVRDGRIEKVGSRDKIPVPEGYTVIKADGMVVTPGLIDPHNHTMASDLHDNVFQVNPELRVLDNIDMETPAARIAVAGGVTTVLTIPGSGSNMGGFGILVKTAGSTPDEVIVRFPGALKIAQAGNPERGTGDLGSGRMGMNWLIRNVLREGKLYHEAWERYERGETQKKPKKVLRYEYLRGLYRGEYPCAVHTQQFQVVQSSMRILHDELGLVMVVDHGTFDGYVNGPAISLRDIPVANGPREFWYDRTQGRIIGLAAAWYWLGIKDITVNTDAPVVPQEELIYQATQSVRMGLPENVALRGLTLAAARMMLIDDRLGSLTPGKDADVVIWTGDPFDPRSRTQVVLVNGKVAYDAARDGIRF